MWRPTRSNPAIRKTAYLPFPSRYAVFFDHSMLGFAQTRRGPCPPALSAAAWAWPAAAWTPPPCEGGRTFISRYAPPPEMFSSSPPSIISDKSARRWYARSPARTRASTPASGPENRSAGKAKRAAGRSAAKSSCPVRNAAPAPAAQLRTPQTGEKKISHVQTAAVPSSGRGSFRRGLRRPNSTPSPAQRAVSSPPPRNSRRVRAQAAAEGRLQQERAVFQVQGHPSGGRRALLGREAWQGHTAQRKADENTDGTEHGTASFPGVM